MSTRAPLPANFLRASPGPKEPFSHERLLRVCRAYQRLYEIAVAQGLTLTTEVYQSMRDIDREIAYWETRSSRLRYQAKKQRFRRADEREEREDTASAAFDEISDTFGGVSAPDSTQDLKPVLAALPNATKEALARYRRGKTERGDADDQPRPDTSDYRKSGLV